MPDLEFTVDPSQQRLSGQNSSRSWVDRAATGLQAIYQNGKWLLVDPIGVVVAVWVGEPE